MAKMWVTPASESVFRNTDEVVYNGHFDSETPLVRDTGVVRAVSEEVELERDDEDIRQR